MTNRRELTVYELIQELSKYPADMPILTAVIAEKIEPLNLYADKTVDIDAYTTTPEITVKINTYYGKRYVRLEVALT